MREGASASGAIVVMIVSQGMAPDDAPRRN
jgi:hypothetical protein